MYDNKCLRQVPLLALKGRVLSTGGVCGSLWLLYSFGCRKGGIRCQNASNKVPKTTKMKTNIELERAKQPSKTALRSRVEQVSKKDAQKRKHCVPFSAIILKITRNTISTRNH